VTFIIEWVDRCLGSEEVLKVNTPAGTLSLTHINGVISQMDWDLNLPVNDSQDHELHQKFTAYWINPAQSISVKLLKQGSDYRHRVWAALNNIPLGTTLAYSSLASIINSSARAVGNACRDNPYPVIIPCHRVVSVSGMGGYCGQTEGDLMTIKSKLLNYESRFI
jgi:methylated-DNA-[protein]-cysteine S-methyltransferase